MSEPNAPLTRHLWPVPDPVRETLAGYLERWLSNRRSLRPSTRQSYEAHIRLHISPRIGDIPLIQLARNDVERMFDDLLVTASRLHHSTVVRVYATLCSALNHAVACGLIPSNPARHVELPTPLRERPEPWSAVELSRFLDCVVGDPDYPLWALLSLRGLRRGEALGLTWSDVELDAGVLRIRQQLTTVSGRLEVRPPKSRAGKRTIAMDTRLRRILYLRGCQQRLHAREHDWQWSDATLVFTTPAGTPRNPLDVTRRFQSLVRLHDMRAIRLHDLRHTSASIGLASGESLLEVSRRLGHSSLSITADIYSEIVPATAAASAERLSNHVLGAR